MENLAQKLKKARIVAVLAVNEPADSADLAKALCDGGVTAIEMTLRTPRAFECASAIASAGLPLTLGIGARPRAAARISASARAAMSA